MSCQHVDITAKLNDTWVKHLIFENREKDAEGEIVYDEEGEPIYTRIDITGDEVQFTISDDVDDEPLYKQVVTEHTNAVLGETQITVDWTNLDYGTYYYDIVWVQASEEVRTLLKGKFKICTDLL